MDFAQTPYAVKIDASLPGIKCYLRCRLQYMHAYRLCFSLPLISFCLSIALPVLFSLPFIVIPHSTLSTLSPGKESVAVKSTFQKFLLLFGNNGNILFK